MVPLSLRERVGVRGGGAIVAVLVGLSAEFPRAHPADSAPAASAGALVQLPVVRRSPGQSRDGRKALSPSRVSNPMPIDLYSPCPGGTGKKIKFCCPDFVNELNEIERLIEGEQFAACLQRSNSVNLAARLEDGKQINIPSQNASMSASSAPSEPTGNQCSLYRSFNFNANCYSVRQPGQYQYCDSGTIGYPSKHWPGDCTKHRDLSSTAWTIPAHRGYYECARNWPGNVW